MSSNGLAPLHYGAVSADKSDVGLNTVEMIENHGYVCENHFITTEDGYILTFQRIPYGKNGNNTTKRPPVLLMHGLTSSSADFVSMGPNTSLSYILADIGYDVWLGNARGNDWSRNHTTLDVINDGEEFYKFSWHEIGYYDLAAAIDYILGVNGDQSLYYVGHSQGTTSFLVLASTRPEYNDKIKIASLMGPAAFMENQSLIPLQVLSKYINEIEKLLQKYKIYDIPFLPQLRPFLSNFCGQPKNYDLCAAVIGVAVGSPDTPQLNFEMLSTILTNAPSNAGLKQAIHYGQLIKNKGFSQYDYGSEKNKEIYGTERPPAYDLSQITAPVAVYYGKNDLVVNSLDVQNLVKKLPNVANNRLIAYELFNHLDFVIAKDVVEMLYIELINVMQRY